MMKILLIIAFIIEVLFTISTIFLTGFMPVKTPMRIFVIVNTVFAIVLILNWIITAKKEKKEGTADKYKSIFVKAAVLPVLCNSVEAFGITTTAQNSTWVLTYVMDLYPSVFIYVPAVTALLALLAWGIIKILRMNKKTKISAGVVVLLVSILPVCAYLYVMVPKILYEIETNDPQNKVRFSDGSIIKKAVFTGKNGVVQTIQPVGSVKPGVLAVLGVTGASFISSANYNEVFSKTFKKIIIGKGITNLKSNWDFDVLLGGGGFADVGLCNPAGEELWIYKKADLPPNKMIAGDLNRDGKDEYYVADKTGLIQLDAKGVEKWKVARGEISDMGIVGGNKLFAMNTKGNAITTDYRGKVLSEKQFQRYTGSFSIIKQSGVEKIAAGYFGNGVGMLDMQGNTLGFYAIQKFPLYHNPQAVSVKFKKDTAPYLAVLAHSSGVIGKTILSVFSAAEELVYQEILDYNFAICAVPRGNHEVLLIGDGQGGLLEYSMIE
jgi:hypothetical protein